MFFHSLTLYTCSKTVVITITIINDKCDCRGTADWFGVSNDVDATQKWQRKSLRHCTQRYGKLKPQVIREMDLASQDNLSMISTETPPPLYVPPAQHGMQRVSWTHTHPFIMVQSKIA